MKDEITVFQIYNNEKHINNIFCFSTNCKQKRYSSTYIFLCSSISFEELNTNLIRLTKYELNDSFLKCEEIPSGYSSGDRFFTLNLTLWIIAIMNLFFVSWVIMFIIINKSRSDFIYHFLKIISSTIFFHVFIIMIFVFVFVFLKKFDSFSSAFSYMKRS